jgi:hypothetical protein
MYLHKPVMPSYKHIIKDEDQYHQNQYCMNKSTSQYTAACGRKLTCKWTILLKKSTSGSVLKRQLYSFNAGMVGKHRVISRSKATHSCIGQEKLIGN